jgi:hypothetical protein
LAGCEQQRPDEKQGKQASGHDGDLRIVEMVQDYTFQYTPKHDSLSIVIFVTG